MYEFQFQFNTDISKSNKDIHKILVCWQISKYLIVLPVNVLEKIFSLPYVVLLLLAYTLSSSIKAYKITPLMLYEGLLTGMGKYPKKEHNCFDSIWPVIVTERESRYIKINQKLNTDSFGDCNFPWFFYNTNELKREAAYSSSDSLSLFSGLL